MFWLAKSKKGISVIIGYVLLIVFTVVLAIIVFQWMQSYVPIEELTCPGGVSLTIDNYQCVENQLILNLRNNGKFNLGGYFVYATTSPNVNVATFDLSNYTDSASQLYPSGVKLGGNSSGNSLVPGGNETETFNLTDMGVIYSLELTPIRWLKEENRIKLSSCKDARIKEIINCSGAWCISDCGIRECGNDPVCGKPCGTCTGEELCNSTGQCIPPAQCNETCAGKECGTVCGNICGPNNGLCILANATPVCKENLCVLGGSCLAGYGNCDEIDSNGCETVLGTNAHCSSCTDVCATDFNCINDSCTSLGNGKCESWETCYDEPIACEGYQTNCTSGEICISGECAGIGEGYGCYNYCVSLLHIPPYLTSTCTKNSGQCSNAGGDVVGGEGDIFCTQQNPSYGKCCCFTH